jgi:hypothetical protein
MEYVLGSVVIPFLVCWFLVVVQSSRMFSKFRKKYPEIARKEIVNALEPYRDPDKFFFFFKKNNIPLLQKDKEIWSLRQQVKILFFLSILFLFASIMVILLIVIFLAEKV